jgi:hypothetical protein
MGDHSEIVSGKPAEQKQMIHASQPAAYKTLLLRIRGGRSGIVHAIKTAVSFHVGNTIICATPKALPPLETAPIISVHAVLQYCYCPLDLVRFFFC